MILQHTMIYTEAIDWNNVKKTYMQYAR